MSGSFHTLTDGYHGSSGKGAVAPRLVEILGIPNSSSSNFPNAGHCMPGGTHIVTPNGIKTLESLVENKHGEVLTMTGKPQAISHYFNEGGKATLTTHLSNGNSVTSTPEHRFYVWDADLERLEWIRTDELEPDRHQFVIYREFEDYEGTEPFLKDKFVFEREPGYNVTNISVEDIDLLDLSFWCGQMLGDGSYGLKSTSFSLAFDSRQLDNLERTKKLYETMGIPYRMDTVKPTCYTINTSSISRLNELFDCLGWKRQVGEFKTVPDFIMNGTKPMIRTFLSGLFDADGTVKRPSGKGKNKGQGARITFTSISGELIKQVQLLLYVVGIHSKIRCCVQKNRDKDIWELDIASNYCIEKFAKEIGFKSSYKSDRLKEMVELKHESGASFDCSQLVAVKCKDGYKTKMAGTQDIINKILGKFWLINIERQEDSGIQTVYDITVPGDHSYIANGVISHNTVILDGHKVVFKYLPASAILRRKLHTPPQLWVGPNSGVYADQLKYELDETMYRPGFDLHIHARSAIIEDFHANMEKPGGVNSSVSKIASTMSGAGAAYTQKAMRDARTRYVGEDTGLPVLQPWDFVDAVHKELEQGRSFLHEVSQGFALSLDYGSHPRHCTFRNCTPQQARADMAIPQSTPGEVFLNLRSFPIRVGNFTDSDGKMIGYSGDFMSDSRELTWREIGEQAEFPPLALAELEEKERTTVTKRVRRVFSHSTQLLQAAVKTCGATKLILNFTNYLHYSSLGARGGEKEFKQLHANVRSFVDRLEDETGLPVVMLGTGPNHEDYIWRL